MTNAELEVWVENIVNRALSGQPIEAGRVDVKEAGIEAAAAA